MGAISHVAAIAAMVTNVLHLAPARVCGPFNLTSDLGPVLISTKYQHMTIAWPGEPINTTEAKAAQFYINGDRLYASFDPTGGLSGALKCMVGQGVYCGNGETSADSFNGSSITIDQDGWLWSSNSMDWWNVKNGSIDGQTPILVNRISESGENSEFINKAFIVQGAMMTHLQASWCHAKGQNESSSTMVSMPTPKNTMQSYADPGFVATSDAGRSHPRPFLLRLNPFEYILSYIKRRTTTVASKPYRTPFYTVLNPFERLGFYGVAGRALFP